MSLEEFERHKEALAAQRLEKPKKLSVLSARFWSEITSQQYNFDRANIEVAHLRTMKKQDILEFYKVMSESETVDDGRNGLAEALLDKLTICGLKGE